MNIYEVCKDKDVVGEKRQWANRERNMILQKAHGNFINPNKVSHSCVFYQKGIIGRIYRPTVRQPKCLRLLQVI